MLNNQSVPMSRTAYFVFGPGFTLMGLIFVALGCFFGLHMENFLEHAVSTTGVVIELRSVTDRDNHRTTFAPTFRFSAEDGHIYEIRSTASSNPAEFSVGDVVDVLYLSADPSGAIIDTFLQKWLTTGVLLLVGLTFSVVGGVALVVGRNVLRRSSAAVPVS